MVPICHRHTPHTRNTSKHALVQTCTHADIRARTHTHTHANRESARARRETARERSSEIFASADTFIQIAPGVVRILGRIQQGIIAVSTFAAGATLKDLL
jgi:hypothetical protein